MLYSMTGYGKSENTFQNTYFQIEIRSLNSKGLDMHLRTPMALRHKELDIRNKVGEQLKRGKIDIFIRLILPADQQIAPLNEDIFNFYYDQIEGVALKKNLDQTNLLPAILNLPNLFVPSDDYINEQVWENMSQHIQQAIDQVTAFRKQEGKEMQQVILTASNNISQSLQRIPNYEEERIQSVRDRLTKNLDQIADQGNMDQNRYEQEIIYYIEKLDISEEKVRLKAHLDYFNELVNASDEMAKGKKLNFVAQEIGREINTIGSKANHAEIQRLVINMKDNLEQIKEQLSNIL